MKSTDYAWAAGLFDGEGSFTLNRLKPQSQPPYYRHFAYKYPRATMSQKDREVLDRFQEVVGTGKVYGPYPSSKRLGSCPFHFMATGKSAYCQILNRLWSYLGSQKKRQAIRVLVASL